MADNTFVNFGGHKVSAGKKYSTSEVRTGDVWTDGKPIYRKAFIFGGVTMQSVAWYSTVTLPNVARMWLAEGTYTLITNGTTDFITGVCYKDTDNFTSCRAEVQRGTPNVNLVVFSSYWQSFLFEFCFVLEYTKTTD